MKNYFTLSFLLVSVFCFGQLEPISQFENQHLGYYRFGMTPLDGAEKYGNSLIINSEGTVSLMLLDENFQLLKKQLLDFRPVYSKSLSRKRQFYFQTEEFVYGIFQRKKGKAPEIVQIAKADFKVTKKNAIIPKSEKTVSSTEEGGFLYILTREKKTKDLSLYKFLGLDLVEKKTFPNSGKHPLTSGKKEFVSSKNEEKIFFSDNSGKLFFQNEKVYFVKHFYQKRILCSQTLVLDFQTLKSESHQFTYNFGKELEEGKTAVFNTDISEKKRIAVQIIDDKLYQCFRKKELYILNIYDLESETLIETRNLNELLSNQNIKDPKRSYGKPTFSGLLVGAEKTGFQEFMDWNASGGFAKSTVGLRIYEFADSNSMVIFGKNKTLKSSGGGYIPGTPGNGFIPGTPGSFYGSGSGKTTYQTHFGITFLDANESSEIEKNPRLERIEAIQAHIRSERKATKKKKSKHFHHKVFYTNGEYRLITYNDRKRTFEIF